MAKLIAHGSDRTGAIARMRGARRCSWWWGFITSLPLRPRILAHEDFVVGKIDTSFLARSGFIPEKT